VVIIEVVNEIHRFHSRIEIRL